MGNARQDDKALLMSEPDTPLIELSDITAALGLLSRLPANANAERGALVAWAFPVVGMIIGGLVAILGWILLWLGLSASLTAGLMITAQIAITGAMHEDGLADTVDGLWGGWDQERRLEIMKDSRIGTYGVLALGLSLILRWSALSALINAGMLFAPLIAIGAISRVPMGVMMGLMPQAREAGLSASVGVVPVNTALIGVGIGAVLGLLLLGWSAFGVIIITGLASLGVAMIAQRKIGGQTGDILGASQQVAEICALITLATFLA